MSVSKVVFQLFLGIVLGALASQVAYQAIVYGLGENRVEHVATYFPIVGAVLGFLIYPVAAARTAGDGFIPLLGWLLASASLIGVLAYSYIEVFYTSTEGGSGISVLLIFAWVVVAFAIRFIFLLLRKRRDTDI